MCVRALIKAYYIYIYIYIYILYIYIIGPPQCSRHGYGLAVNHSFTGLIALIKRLLHILSKVSQNKTNQRCWKVTSYM